MEEDKRSNTKLYNMTQDEVAKVMGISRSKVDTIERNAIRKLKYILVILKKFNKKDFF